MSCRPAKNGQSQSAERDIPNSRDETTCILTYGENLRSANLNHVLLERLGAQEVVLGLADKRATRTERDLAERGRERGRGLRFGLEGERLLLGGLGGPLGTEKVGGEAGNVRRGHPVRLKMPLVRPFLQHVISPAYMHTARSRKQYREGGKPTHEVPEIELTERLPVFQIERMLRPGAKISTHLP
jgi:hypothetical protein